MRSTVEWLVAAGRPSRRLEPARAIGHTVDVDDRLLAVSPSTSPGSRSPSGCRRDSAGVRRRLPAASARRGTLTTTLRQLTELGLESRYDEVIEEVTRVRAELGYPIMVTPFPQIVVQQALSNIIGGERYETVSDQLIRYVLGRFGRPAVPIEPAGAGPHPGAAAGPRRLSASRDRCRPRSSARVPRGISDEEFLLRATMPAAAGRRHARGRACRELLQPGPRAGQGAAARAQDPAQALPVWSWRRTASAWHGQGAGRQRPATTLSPGASRAAQRPEQSPPTGPPRAATARSPACRLVSQLHPQAGVRLAQVDEPGQPAVFVHRARLELEPGTGQRVDVLGEPAAPVGQVVESTVLAPPDGSGLLRDQLEMGRSLHRVGQVDLRRDVARRACAALPESSGRRPAQPGARAQPFHRLIQIGHARTHVEEVLHAGQQGEHGASLR